MAWWQAGSKAVKQYMKSTQVMWEPSRAVVAVVGVGGV